MPSPNMKRATSALVHVAEIAGILANFSDPKLARIERSVAQPDIRVLRGGNRFT